MATSTMLNLRNINPIASTAAILNDHRLTFNVPGTPFVEPSWAAVEEEIGSKVHGVLYKLSEEDFAKVCQTEGVPFAYRLHRCKVIPYIGDGKTAGEDALSCSDIKSTPAFTLIAGRQQWRKSNDIPPSKSYLNVLLRGAKEFEFDEDYVTYLQNIKTATNVIGGGFAEKMLEVAEMRKSQ